MSPELFRELLERVKLGQVSVASAVEEVRHLPYRDIGVAVIDHHRALRQGVPEVVFGLGKSIEQLTSISAELVSAGSNLLITRLREEHAAELVKHHPKLKYSRVAQVARLEQHPVTPRPCAPVAVVSAGTSDIPVAEEALETLDAIGIPATRIFDVGVAGIHRLMGRSEDLESASAAIVIAGMEGALPSVVAGLVACPVVAVPTSVGYGTALGGFTALMSMLTSCASGLTVVNIDNGFGAAMALHRILPRGEETAT